MLNWIAQTRNRLKNLLPAIHPNRSPTTTNEIERFFKELVRFYQTRCGVHAVISAKRELTFFLVVYLFTIQPESGNAPIEKIIPEAKDMPLYSLLNDPFACGVTPLVPHVKPLEEMATASMKRVA